MKYMKFTITDYRAIKKVSVDLSPRIVPLVGVNECGKTTILKGVFCFDYTNDSENKGEHLQNLENLYSTTAKDDAIIEAEISVTKQDVSRAISDVIAEKTSEQAAKPGTAVPASPQSSLDNDIQVLQELADSLPKLDSIIISRNLATKLYYSSAFSCISANDNHLVCKKLVWRLPYILYNDDFNDRPVSEIVIASDNNDPWFEIFERVFQSANKDYELVNLFNEEDRRRRSILDNVEDYLNKSLTKAWSKFSSEKIINVKVKLEHKSETTADGAVVNKLNILISEKRSKISGNFYITDRSKGFIWYYNFIMKIIFNPKQSGTTNETIFLLDEPGSFLHEIAQIDLCKRLREISEKEGIVIYCTHSPKLLIPTEIPFNSIMLVDKNKNAEITILPAKDKNNTSSQRNSAMQPVYEALLIPEYTSIDVNQQIVCVEGIYDKYCIEIFADINTNIRLFPSTTAGAIAKNVQYFITYDIPYMALWDNDEEGLKEKKYAEQFFGPVEAKKFDTLPLINNRKDTRMEDMIDKSDYALLCEKLNLGSSAKYEAIICDLYFMDDKKRSSIIKSLSLKTKDNFKVLSKIIKKHFPE